MLKSAFDKLLLGDRVLITNAAYGISNTRGRIITVDKSDNSINVRTDNGNANWFFRMFAKEFTITVERETVAAPAPKKAPKGPQAYRGNGKHDWETVTTAGDRASRVTVRLRVPGGWLYGIRFGTEVLSQTTFVPVPTVVGYAI